MDASPPGPSTLSGRPLAEPGAPAERRRARRSGRRRRIATALALAPLALLLPTSGTVGACDPLAVPSLALERCVVAGDQSQIDAGHVVRVDVLSSDAVHWLAGHRTSHGGTFRSLTELRIGARVAFRGTTYEIIDHVLVDRTAPAAVADWVTAATPTLVLQTSASGTWVHAWRAVPQSVARPGTTPASDAGGATAEAGARRGARSATRRAKPDASTADVAIVSSAGDIGTTLPTRSTTPPPAPSATNTTTDGPAIAATAAVLRSVLVGVDAASAHWR